MRTVGRWSGVVVLAALGVFHVLFSFPNFLFTRDCEGEGLVALLTCDILYEALLSLAAGLALIGAAVLAARRSPRGAFVLGAAGTVPLSLFFWFVAVPTGLSDVQFGWASLPVPIAMLLGWGVTEGLSRRRPAPPAVGAA